MPRRKKIPAAPIARRKAEWISAIRVGAFVSSRISRKPQPFWEGAACQSLKPTTATDAAAMFLSVNNIEVVYDHVILVLKGVSLDVPRGGIVALLGANGAGQDNDAEGGPPICLHAERGEVTKGSILFDGVEVAVAVAKRTGATRLHSGDGGAAFASPTSLSKKIS